MDLKKILRKELVFFSNLSKKKDKLEALIQLVANENLVKDVKTLHRSIFSRESVMSTGLGLGIAVPHARIKGLENIIIAIGINKNGIEDYESLDGSIVKVVIMIIAGEKQHREYLQLLSQMVKILKKNSRINDLLETAKPEDVISLISEDFNGSRYALNSP